MQGSSEMMSAPVEPGAFHVELSGPPDAPLVTVTGELDLGTAPRLRDALRALPDGLRLVELDLSGVSFIDSTALGVLLAAYKRHQTVGGEFTVIASSPVVAKVLEISGLSSLLGIGTVAGQAGGTES